MATPFSKKTAQDITAPSIQFIDGKPAVRVIDLAHQWDTTTSNILATCKYNHVPAEYLHIIDGCIWCEFAGLRYRLKATSRSSAIIRHIREFLDSHAEKPTETTAAAPSNPADTEKRTEKRIDNLTAAIRTRQAEKIQALENDSYRRFDNLMARCHRIELRQGDNAIELTGVKQDVRLLKLAAVMFAILHVVGGIIRLARHR